MKRRIALLAIIAVVLAIVGVGAAFIVSNYNSRVYLKAVLEAGDTAITPDDFKKSEKYSVSFADGFDPQTIDTRRPGEYSVKLKSGLFRYNALLTVADTVAPIASALDQSIAYGQRLEIVDFYTEITDQTKCVAQYETAPDFSKIGTQNLRIAIIDLGGNRLVLEPKLFIDPMKSEHRIVVDDPAPKLSDLVLPGANVQEIVPLTPLESIDTSKARDVMLEFTCGADSFKTLLHIADLIPPEVTVRNVTSFVGAALTPEDFIESFIDDTDVTFAFLNEPELSTAGSKTVLIRATDASGNFTDVSAELTVVSDTNPPTIIGVRDINSYLGEPISYLSGVTVKDDYDKNVKIDVDIREVDIYNAGEYGITYSATDASGNTATESAIVRILEKNVNEQAVYDLADQIIAEITNSSMTPYQKLEAIYIWLRQTIDYKETNEKDDWIGAAYMGLHDHTGDCFIYQSASKALLDAAGIENKLIDTIPLRYLHCWNLVNIGEGWYHFDATPRKGGFYGLYISDAAIKQYSDSHNNSHIYDREKYTGIE